MKLSSKAYDILKFLCTILIPAVSGAYVGLSQLWGGDVFPYAEQIAGTLAVVTAFIGSLIGISSRNYWKEIQEEDQNA